MCFRSVGEMFLPLRSDPTTATKLDISWGSESNCVVVVDSGIPAKSSIAKAANTKVKLTKNDMNRILFNQ